MPNISLPSPSDPLKIPENVLLGDQDPEIKAMGIYPLGLYQGGYQVSGRPCHIKP